MGRVRGRCVRWPGTVVMARLAYTARARAFLRSFAIQGSWNYRTMLGAGLAFALVPVLSRVYRDDRQALAEAIGRHAAFFNAHPYLAGVAVGALVRLEIEGTERGLVDRLKGALVSPLGTLGDRLFWARWRPLSALAAMVVFLVGAPWWVACLVFLVLYNVLHVGIRAWAFQLGWSRGREVGRALLGSPLRRVPERLTIPLAAIGGALLPWTLLELGRGSGFDVLPVLGIGVVSTFFGLWRPTVAAHLAVGGLFLTFIAGVWL